MTLDRDVIPAETKFTWGREIMGGPSRSLGMTGVTVSVAHQVLQLRQVLAAQRLRVDRREARHPPELPPDQAQ